MFSLFFFFLTDTSPTEIYPYCHTLSLHDALPIWRAGDDVVVGPTPGPSGRHRRHGGFGTRDAVAAEERTGQHLVPVEAAQERRRAVEHPQQLGVEIGRAHV